MSCNITDEAWRCGLFPSLPPSLQHNDICIAITDSGFGGWNLHYMPAPIIIMSEWRGGWEVLCRRGTWELWHESFFFYFLVLTLATWKCPSTFTLFAFLIKCDWLNRGSILDREAIQGCCQSMQHASNINIVLQFLYLLFLLLCAHIALYRPLGKTLSAIMD